MQPAMKILIGLAATLAMGWINHGPLGQGEALIDGIEANARAAVAEAGLPGVEVRLGRDPLSRVVTLSGPADDFQREGMGGLPGLNERVAAVDGVSRVEWANPPPARTGGR
jgi:hypothetical protein